MDPLTKLLKIAKAQQTILKKLAKEDRINSKFETLVKAIISGHKYTYHDITNLLKEELHKRNHYKDWSDQEIKLLLKKLHDFKTGKI